MEDDPLNQAMADARSRRQTLRELRRVLNRSPLMQPSSGVVRSNITNGYFNDDGDFVRYWLAGDTVTGDGSDSFDIAP